jgi:23S rRNA (cytosine1962-C5)-methyltransferase
MTAPRPTARLRPKIDPRALRRGFPWIYDNQLVFDRRTRSVLPGTLVRVEDAERRPIGLAALNPASRISARLVDRDPEATIDRAWFAARLRRALTLRERLFDAPFYRLVHAEADGLPGVIVDRFGDVAAIQPNAAWAELLLDHFADALAEVTGVSTIVKNASGRARAAEGLDDVTTIVRGTLDAPVAVAMNGATYLADLIGGQKTGLFYDQRPNHAFAARLARGGTVLDVFAHVGGFALAALAAGATHALAVDGSAPALDLAHRGAEAGGTAESFDTRRGDAFDVMKVLEGDGATFGTVVCDPPSFAPSKSALDAGLRAYEKVARRAAPLVAPDGYLVLCSCSHAADLANFREASLRGIGRAGRRAQILHTGFAGPDHPTHAHLAESGYLKALFLRLD